MAVAKEIVLEADASTSSSSSSSTDQEVEEVSDCFSSRCEPLFDDGDGDGDGGDNGRVNLDDNDVIKQSCVTLSNEALKLLKHASRSVMKRKQRRIGRRRGGAAAITRSLYEELQSLRNLIAPHTIAGDITNAEPCVITDALGYLTLLKQEIKDLNEGLMKSIKEPNSRVSQDAQVEVVSSGQRLEIYVSCNKRAGLLAELMLLLESTGLVFDDVNASCHHRLLFKACSTQKGVHVMDKQAIRRAVLMAIQQM